jgi:hypothetical protein
MRLPRVPPPLPARACLSLFPWPLPTLAGPRNLSPWSMDVADSVLSPPAHHCFSAASAATSTASPSSASKHLGFKPDFNRQRSAMSVSPQITRNPHLLLSIYLFTVRRRALVDMHSGSARVRVQSDSCNCGVVSPLDMPMMNSICAQT